MSRLDPKEVDIEDAFRQGTPIDEAMNQAFRDAVLAHKRAGVPLVVWRDGRVQLVSADEIQDEAEAPAPSAENPRPTPS